MNSKPAKTIALTLFALLAFAGNSVLCRLALGEETIDPAGFTIVRLLSGIAMLIPLMYLSGHKSRQKKESGSHGSWPAAGMLFLYAVTLSYGYISLDTGTGALILFAAVQMTMILLSVMAGSRLHTAEWLGLMMAFSGLVYLILPGLSTPSFTGFILMAVSGAAWGVYTLLGRSSKNPLGDTAYNFLRTLPFVIVLALFTFRDSHLSADGIMLAGVSGALTSGVGYFVWYLALGGLTVTQAAVVQLFVPVIATIGGVIFSNELVTLRLVAASVLVLGGILMVIMGKKYFALPATEQI